MPATIHKKMGDNPSRKRIKGGFWTGSLMTVAILTITGFQFYWLKNNYDRENENLKITTKSSFQETVLKLQASKMKLDKMTFHLDTIKVSATSNNKKPIREPLRIGQRFTDRNTTYTTDNESVITIMNLLQQKMRDSLGMSDSGRKRGIIALRSKGGHAVWTDSMKGEGGFAGPLPPVVMPMLDSLLGSPENIKSVKVDGRDKSDRVITISYKSEKTKDSLIHGMPGNIILRNEFPDSIREIRAEGKMDIQKTTNDGVFRFLYNMDSIYIKDSVTVKDITTAYDKKLKEDNINVPFSIERLDSTQEKSPDAVTIGFTTPVSFELSLGNTWGYMISKLKLPILFSLLLVALTIAAFFFLYRNMIRQKRLAEMKNDLISNISHELKTPIATVGVALEALQSFNAMHDPARTKEYLDISQSELQRLNLLVDKVLKLSIFEKKDIELKKERFDYKQLTTEIMNSMRLQFEKYHAKLTMHTEGDSFYLDADKLHITSVVYNLLDNALKYSKENPAIHVQLKSSEEWVELSVQDNGIGIPKEYKGKIFDKFFRVPTGDQHNIKGYGLGLSYVAEVVKRHQGQISVESEYGTGSTFTVRLPAAKTPVITLDSVGPGSSKPESKKQTS